MAEAPAEGNVAEMEAGGVAVCLARIQGKLSAIDNWCPHRHGPMGQGWVEGNSVVCPWHSWTFDVSTGEAEWPVRDRIACTRFGWMGATFWWILRWLQSPRNRCRFLSKILALGCYGWRTIRIKVAPAGNRLVNDLKGETAMKFRKLMLAVLGLAVVVGMTVPANAMAHKHHRKHHHRKG